MTIATTLEAFLGERQTDYSLITHPHTGSSHETAEAALVLEDHIAKAVLVKDANTFFLVVIPADHWVKMKAISHELNRTLELATEKEIAAIFTDCEIGAIPPVGNAYGVDTLLDKSITSLSNVYFEAGALDHLVHTSGDSFMKLLGGSRQGYFCEK